MIKGDSIIYKARMATGNNGFGEPVYGYTDEQIDNIVIQPLSDAEVTDSINLTGRKAVYLLHIPKGDTHDWVNQYVEFWGGRYRTIGEGKRYQSELCPLLWDRQIMVESIGGQEA